MPRVEEWKIHGFVDFTRSIVRWWRRERMKRATDNSSSLVNKKVLLNHIQSLIKTPSQSTMQSSQNRTSLILLLRASKPPSNAASRNSRKCVVKTRVRPALYPKTGAQPDITLLWISEQVERIRPVLQIITSFVPPFSCKRS